MRFKALLSLCLLSSFLLSSPLMANPYFDQSKVPTDAQFAADSGFKLSTNTDVSKLRQMATNEFQGEKAFRVQIDWQESTDDGDAFHLSHMVIEPSGTQALRLRNQKSPSPFGSYKATLHDAGTGELIAWDSIGTGKEFRKLSRAIHFRFPLPEKSVVLKFYAEDATSGEINFVFEKFIIPSDIQELELDPKRRTSDVTLIKEASHSPRLIFTIYAEGYKEQRFRPSFIRDAVKVAETLEAVGIPYVDHFEFRAVYNLSEESLGTAQRGAMPVPDRDSFLGLYFPYWNDFGRWYHVLYPTRVKHYRDSLGQVAYDYPLALVDNAYYWGVGNFKELTAIPSESNYFAYLLTHEFGHFLGLNEEYQGGGRTELEFAPHVHEPWSQNITFLKEASELKWKQFVSTETPLPTPRNFWSRPIDPAKPFGAFEGGYADSPANTQSYKPGLSCVMESGRSFCPICKDGMAQVIGRDLGLL